MISKSKAKLLSIFSIIAGFFLGIFSTTKIQAAPPGAAVAAGVVQHSPNDFIPIPDFFKDFDKVPGDEVQTMINCLQSFLGTGQFRQGTSPMVDDLIWCQLREINERLKALENQ
jgi:hypothetical protein